MTIPNEPSPDGPKTINGRPAPTTDSMLATIATKIDQYGGVFTLHYDNNTSTWLASVEGLGQAAQPGVSDNVTPGTGPNAGDAITELYEFTWWLRG